MLREIAHIDMDAFFVSVELVRRPHLRGRPVVVGGAPEARGVVASASYEARKYGIGAAMPIYQAKRLCPQAIFLPANHRLYAETSRAMFRILRRYTPFIEETSVDEAYLDLTGFRRLYGSAMTTSEKIQREIREHLQLNASIGLATNKLVAKVASGYAKPAGIMWVLPGYEANFLAPLPLDKLPGVGQSTREKLRAFDIHTIGELAHLPRKFLEDNFGKMGLYLHQRARGYDNNPVVWQPEEAKSVSREQTFPQDTSDQQYLEATLHHLVGKATSKLRQLGARAQTITLKLRYSDFRTITHSITLNEPTEFDQVVFSTARGLLRKLFTPWSKYRLIGIGLSNLSRQPWQLELYQPQKTLRLKELYRCIDQIRGKYGFHYLTVGRSLIL